MSNLNDQEFPDEEDEEDFNPVQEVGSDDEADAKPQVADDEDDNEPAQSRPRSHTRAPAGDDEDELKDEGEEGAGEDDNNENGDEEPQDAEEEEDEEEDEEEEDEDDDIEGQPSRKRRRRRRNQFIDVEAEVDEDDEEEPEEEDDLPGEDVHPDDLQELPPGADRDDRMHRELDRKREAAEAMDVEAEAKRLKERYGRQGRGAASASAIVPQRMLLPGTDDPRIFRMKCRPGKEREILFTLQHRVLERQKSREPVQVLSAFERSANGIQGSLYVEAWRVDDVKAAFDGISHVFMSIQPFMIPLEEMPDLLRIKKSKELEVGMYVRPKRGLYTGDLAQVEEVEPNGTTVTLRLVPRLDYGLTEDANAAAPVMEPDGQGGTKRKRVQKPTGQRPPARLFSETEARKRHSKYLSSKNSLSATSFTYLNKEYINGFLVDVFKLAALQTENVDPTLEEATRFASGGEDGTDNLDLAALSATLKTSAGADYLPGDKVEVFRGEQRGVNGRAVEVYGEVVKMRVEEGPLTGQVIEAPIRDLRKLFREGDHVKVVGGSKFLDEVGMVVKTAGEHITVLTDSNQTEITMFAKDLREATDSGGAVGVSKYDLFDLVQLDASTIGCVVKVDRESLRVLDQTGSTRSLLPSNISNKIEKKRDQVPATDHLGNEIKNDDTIKEVGGEQRAGRVLQVQRGFVFAQSRELRDNSGVFVARTSNVETVAAKGGRIGPDLTKMNTALKPNGAGGAPMAPPQQRGRDKLIGRTVKIRMGPQKGMIGIVKDTSDRDATLELHAKTKKIRIAKEKLAVIDPHTGQTINTDARTFGTGSRPGGPPGRTPMTGGATPFRGGPPPGAAGGRTPAYAMGGRTPAWKQDGGRTPAYAAAGGGGGQTAYGGSGFGGATAYGGNTSYGGQTSYGGGTTYGGGSVWGGGGGGVSL